MGSRLRDDIKHFYECFCEVVPRTADKEPWIIQKYPESYSNEEVLRSIVNFAYPCDFENVAVQHYSFVLTNIDSKWTFGFCRHDVKTETAIVVLSYLPWHDVFYKFLNKIAEIMSTPTCHDDLGEFLHASHAMPLPKHGFPITVLDSKGKTVTFSGVAPDKFQLPRIGANINITEYYNAVDSHNMIVIFASMLNERRIIITSKRLHRLSSCVQSANDLIYPMIWQHIFIPVLPMSLKDYLLAPMPYLIGVPEHVLKQVRKSDIGDVVILNADVNVVDTPFDDMDTFPHDIVAAIKRQFRNTSELIEDGVARIFLRALVQLIGGYRDALRFPPGDKITFNPDAFIESRAPAMQPFLRKMLDLQIFQQFIDERLQMLNDGLGFSDEFEVEACNYQGKSSSKIKQQYKEFIKTVKDKKFLNNPTMRSAVKSVKEGGKGMRSAYKGLKSKLRDSPTATSDFERHTMPNYHSQASSTKPKSAPSSPTSSSKRKIISTAAKTSYRKAQMLKSGVDGTNPAYCPLSSSTTSSKINSPDNAVDLEQINSFAQNLQTDMDLLREMQEILNSRSFLDESVNEGDFFGQTNGDSVTPPVDRSLKPVRSLENFTKNSESNNEHPPRPPSNSNVSNWWNTSEYESFHSRVSNNSSPSHQNTSAISASPTFPSSSTSTITNNRKKLVSWYNATPSSAHTMMTSQQSQNKQQTLPLSLNHIMAKSASYNILDSQHDDSNDADVFVAANVDSVDTMRAHHNHNVNTIQSNMATTSDLFGNVTNPNHTSFVVGNGHGQNGDSLFLVASNRNVDMVNVSNKMNTQTGDDAHVGNKISRKRDSTTNDLIRLDSTPSSASENGIDDFDPLSSKNNGNSDVLLPKTGLTNPLYPFYASTNTITQTTTTTTSTTRECLMKSSVNVNNNRATTMSQNPVGSNGTNGSNGKTPNALLPNLTSMSSNLNKSEQNLLEEYGIDFNKFHVNDLGVVPALPMANGAATQDTKTTSKNFDPFIPFDSLTSQTVQSKQQWTRFDFD